MESIDLFKFNLRMRWCLALILFALALWSLPSYLPSPVLSGAAMIASAALLLWLLELVPQYATTFLLLAFSSFILGPLDPQRFGQAAVLKWSLQPVLALFLGGFCLALAFSKSGLDKAVASLMIRISGKTNRGLVTAVMLVTAFLSMWMSNVAACALVLVTIKPLLENSSSENNFKKSLLLALACGANFGGIGTPIGTGPNLIAIGSVSAFHKITFLQWMTLAVPFMMLMLSLSLLLLFLLFPVSGKLDYQEPAQEKLSARSKQVIVFGFITIALWLTEAWHGLGAAPVAMLMTGLLFCFGFLEKGDLRKIDWETLVLVAGGLALGELFSESGLAKHVIHLISWDTLPRLALVAVFVSLCALLASISSNTAAAAILIALGLSIDPSPSFAILIAMGAAMGVPFVISTPANTLVYGTGIVSMRDLIVLGTCLMFLGLVVLIFSGDLALSLFRVP